MKKNKPYYIDKDVEIESGVVIFPNCYILGKSKIQKNTIIYPNTIIKDSLIGSGCIIKSSCIEQSEIKNNVTIGPFANIRPNSIIQDNCRIGNFVEIKNSKVDANTKISHLAYVGDAEIGKNCNIGCGVIFVNYNGKEKQKITIKNNCFIGSNCNLIAPVTINDNCYICAGTTVTKNISAGDFVIGRVVESVKKDRAKKYLKEMYE